MDNYYHFSIAYPIHGMNGLYTDISLNFPKQGEFVSFTEWNKVCLG